MAGNNYADNVQPQEILEQLSPGHFENLPDIVLHTPYSSESNVSSHSNYIIDNVSISEGDPGASEKCLASSVISNSKESTFAARPINAQLSDYNCIIDQPSSSKKRSSESRIYPAEFNICSEHFNCDSSEEIVDVIGVARKTDVTEIFNIVDSDEDERTIMPVIEEKAIINYPNEKGYVVDRNPENLSNLNKISSSIENGNCKSIDMIDLTEDNPIEININNSSKDSRMSILLDLLPDADLEFLKMKVDEMITDNDFHMFVATSLDLQNYPKKCMNRNTVFKMFRGKFSSANRSTRKSITTPSMFCNGSSSTCVAMPAIAPHPSTSTDNTFPLPTTYDDFHRSVHVNTPAPREPNLFSPNSLVLPPSTVHPTVYNKPHTATSLTSSELTGIQVTPVSLSLSGSMLDYYTRAPQSPANNTQHHIVSSTQSDDVMDLPQMINGTLQSPLSNHLLPRFPGTDNFYPHVWFPLAVPLPATMLNSSRRRRRLNSVERTLNSMDRRLRYAAIGSTAAAAFGSSATAAFVQNLEAMSNVREEETDSANPQTVQDQRYKLLTDILKGANRMFLQKEVEKFKDDDDLAKFLVKAILNEGLWYYNTSSSKTQKGNKYKILLELFPDASPTFLKIESANFKTDQELHEFAIKLSQDKVYPKRKYVDITPQKQNNKRKKPSDPDSVDPKLKTLLEMLPDADPEFLLQHSISLANDDELQAFVLKAIEENSYPKRDQFLERQEFQKQWKKYIEHFDIKEYLQVIPNPVKYFYIEKKTSRNPSDIPMEFLLYRYGNRMRTCISFGFWKKDNLTLTCDYLDQILKHTPKKYGVWDQKIVYSSAVLQEIAFIQNKKDIAHFMLLRDEIRLIAYEKAKSEGTLQECACCYEEKLSEDMSSCTGGHIYCLSCIKRGSEVVIGNGGTTFPCYSDECKEEFSLTLLKNVLNADVFSRMITRKQYAEVNAAGISGLETCSFCEFCSIPPPEDKLFYCLNPSCMKITCRNCKKIDHLPLSCEEFEKKVTQQKMQSYVEDKMTEALVRTCWQCGTKFVKEHGCNAILCKCGARMCYFCRKPIMDKTHCTNPQCIQLIDTTAHDEEVVLNVGKKAKIEMEVANPGVQLSNDPIEFLKRNRNGNQNEREDPHHLQYYRRLQFF